MVPPIHVSFEPYNFSFGALVGAVIGFVGSNIDH
jgi:hypothetical protein